MKVVKKQFENLDYLAAGVHVGDLLIHKGWQPTRFRIIVGEPKIIFVDCFRARVEFRVFDSKAKLCFLQKIDFENLKYFLFLDVV